MAIYRARPRALCYDASRGFAGWMSARIRCSGLCNAEEGTAGGERDSGVIVRELCVLRPARIDGAFVSSLFFFFFFGKKRNDDCSARTTDILIKN